VVIPLSSNELHQLFKSEYLQNTSTDNDQGRIYKRGPLALAHFSQKLNIKISFSKRKKRIPLKKSRKSVPTALQPASVSPRPAAPPRTGSGPHDEILSLKK